MIHQNPDKPLSPIQNAFAGCFAGFFSSFTLCPTELIKCKLQAARETQAASNMYVMFLSIDDNENNYEKFLL